MKSYETDYGLLKVGQKEELLQEALDQALSQVRGSRKDRCSLALTGGSTPKDFYRWVVENQKLEPELLERIVWTTSDERMVPQSSEDSNFGNADRLMLDPLGVASDRKFPWPTELAPQEAALAYAERWTSQMSPECAYDVCFIGMGDDCHTLSLFPGSPLIANPVAKGFAAVEVPGKGWRLTLTLAGLARCGKVVLSTLGAGKASALKSVLEGEYDPLNKPSQNLRAIASQAIWLVDDAAASELNL